MDDELDATAVALPSPNAWVPKMMERMMNEIVNGGMDRFEALPLKEIFDWREKEEGKAARKDKNIDS